jgi:tetratricopeptide (TPR) repeat protein
MIMTRIILCISILLLTAPVIVRAQYTDEASTYRLAVMYEQAGKLEEALKFYSELYKTHPQNQAYFDGVRKCLTALKKNPEAVAFITARIQTNPDDPVLYIRRGSLYCQMNEEKKGYEDWDHAVGINTKNGAVYSMISDEALNNRLYEKAVEYLKRGRKELGSAQVFVFELARAYTMSLNFEKAMEEYVRYVLDVPSGLQAIEQYIAQFSQLEGATETAIRVTKKFSDDNTSNVALRQLLAWLFMERKDYLSAQKVYEDLDNLRGADGQELWQFALRAFNENANEAAMNALRVFIAKYPKAAFLADAELRYANSAEKYSVQDTSEADDLTAALRKPLKTAAGPTVTVDEVMDLYKKIIEKYPKQPVAIEAAIRLAVVKFKLLHDADDALAILSGVENTRRTAQDRPDVNILIGDIQMSRGNIADALSNYNTVLMIKNLEKADRETAQYKIAEIHFFMGKLDTAIAELQPLTDDSKEDIANDALQLLSFIQQYKGASAAALARFAQVMFLERQGKLTEAMAVLREIIQTYGDAPINDPAYLLLGKFYLRLKQPAEALKAYEEFISKKTESLLLDEALYSLGMLYERVNPNPQKAMEMYQRLLTEFPHSRYINQARDRILLLRKGNS